MPRSVTAELRREWLGELGHHVALRSQGRGAVSRAAARVFTTIDPPASTEITRYLSATGRPHSVTAPAIPREAAPSGRPLTVEYWNLVDLFDLKDDRATADIPAETEVYLRRLQALAGAVRATNEGEGPDILALAGVESLQALRDLAGLEGPLADLGYTVVHVDGPEESGLDNALLTKLPLLEDPTLHMPLDLEKPTRGILEVVLSVDQIPLTIFVAQVEDRIDHSANLLERLCAERRHIDPEAEILVLDDRVTGAQLLDEAVSVHPRVQIQLEMQRRERQPELGGVIVAPGVWVRPAERGLPFVTVQQKLGDPVPRHDPEWYRGLTKDALLEAMRAHQNRPLVLSYFDARDLLFRDIANENGWVECVYTGRKVRAEGVPVASVMNTEHTYPISSGIMDTNQVCDLHHLFPCDPEANRKRSSYPFGLVVEASWESGGSKLGLDTEGRTVFEPPDAHKGTVARAMAYIAMFGAPIDDFMKPTLVEWNERHPPGDEEMKRNEQISLIQGNRNPFIDEAELVRRLWSE